MYASAPCSSRSVAWGSLRNGNPSPSQKIIIVSRDLDMRRFILGKYVPGNFLPGRRRAVAILAILTGASCKPDMSSTWLTALGLQEAQLVANVRHTVSIPSLAVASTALLLGIAIQRVSRNRVSPLGSWVFIVMIIGTKRIG